MTAIGTLFEELFAKLFGLKKVKASGALPFWKLDVEGKRILLSLKATEAKSFRVTKDDLDEALDAIYGPGGLGGDYVPGMAICLVQDGVPKASDPMFIMLEANDLVRLLQEEAEVFALDKESETIQIGETPGLLRKVLDEN